MTTTVALAQINLLVGDIAGNARRVIDCAERLRQYIDAGASSIFLSSACDSDYLERNEQLLADAVMPAFR